MEKHTTQIRRPVVGPLSRSRAERFVRGVFGPLARFKRIDTGGLEAWQLLDDAGRVLVQTTDKRDPFRTLIKESVPLMTKEG